MTTLDTPRKGKDWNKLPETAELQIVDLDSKNYSIRQIAAMTNRAPSTVQRVLHRRRDLVQDIFAEAES